MLIAIFLKTEIKNNKGEKNMAKMHFYDIECLRNIFTLTNYLPEENKVEQYYLADPALEKELANEDDVLANLTKRVRLRNRNFTPGRKTKKLGTGTVELYDLRKKENIMRLAHEFGMSTADNYNDPTDATNLYPNGFRITCDTDKDNGSGQWKPNKVMGRYQNYLQKFNYQDVPAMHNDYVKDMAKLHYHEYDENKDAFLLGYNSYNYDLTILAIFLQDAFTEITSGNVQDADCYSQNDTGYHYFKIEPDSPQILRDINNIMFSSKYKDNMPSILFKSPKTSDAISKYDRMNFRNAFLIRKNMLYSGLHLDVARLNVKMYKVGLKRLLGMLGYQILESDKLKPGTDTIENADLFYELLAYNASDCINLACLMDHSFYKAQFALVKSMLKTYPMIVYDKQKNAYAPDIRPNRVKRNRICIDSSSAQIATNVVCPYGHLNDIPAVSFKYPETRKSKEVGIPQFNVLEQTKDFFRKRVYLPAKKNYPDLAEKANQDFQRIMKFYQYIEGKNFDDSKNYYAYQLGKMNPEMQQDFDEANDQAFNDIFASLNTFDLLTAKYQKFIPASFGSKQIKISRDFIIANKIVPIVKDRQNAVKVADLINYIEAHVSPNSNRKYSQMARAIIKMYHDSTAKPMTSAADFFDKEADERQADINNDAFDYAMFAKKCHDFAQGVFGINLTLEGYQKDFAQNWSLAPLYCDFKPFYPLTIRPYTAKDLPKDNYALAFFNKNCQPTSGYALFSIGGIHGAEYNKELYDQDCQLALNQNQADDNQQLSLFNENIARSKNEKIELPPLFKQSKSGYELNKRYVFTSIDPANHEDFSSYYPSLCRMLNVYWNDGIGRDIYGEVYDRKEKLGSMMKDPKYTPAQRAEYHNQRQGTKLILNSTTGKGDTHGQNSPIQMNNNIISMRLIGQMFTWRIGQAQSLAGAKVISTNTDGLYTVLDDIELNAKILADESKEIHVRIDPERLYLISKDANNRIEEDVNTYEINVPSGGALSAFNGPVPTHSLAHPAAIDRALGLYLQELGRPESEYYDQKLMKPFNQKLGMHLLKNLLGDLSNLSKDERLDKKRKLLNYFQNVIASSPGSNRYIFTSPKVFGPELNDLYLPAKEMSFTQALNTVSPDDFEIVQHYNRVFYIKAKSMPNIKHIYVAAGRKVSDNIKISRKRNHQRVYNNSSVASYILQKNGVSVDKLNAEQSEAQVVKLPSLPSSWDTIFVNQSLASLSEEEVDNLLNNLDYDKYLYLLDKTYTHSWCNNANKKIYMNMLNKMEDSYEYEM